MTNRRLRSALDHATAAASLHSEQAIERLRAYDLAHGGDLVRTLYVYLANGCNASKTAELLYLHRSGLLYRLRRIEELLDVDLSSFRDRVALEIVMLTLVGETDTRED